MGEHYEEKIIIITLVLLLVLPGCDITHLSDDSIIEPYSSSGYEKNDDIEMYFDSSEWTEMPLPKAYSKEYYQLNHNISGHWYVSSEEDNIVISSCSSANKITMDLSSGYFEGIKATIPAPAFCAMLP